MSGKSRVTIYNRLGDAIATIDTSTQRSWVLNSEGMAELKLSLMDAKATYKYLNYGNLVTIEHETLPLWAGVIDTDRTWEKGAVTVSLWSAERLLKFRRSSIATLVSENTAGSLFMTLVNMANDEEDTLIREGQVFYGGVPREETLDAKSIYEHIIQIAERTGYEWDIKSAKDNNNQLYFTANWYERAGYELQFMLDEGYNILAEDSPLKEQGEIINALLGIGDGSTDDSRVTYEETDAASRDAYGLRQGTEDFNGNKELGTLTANVQARLTVTRNPIRTFKVTALDVGNTFLNLRLGNVLRLKMFSVGFLSDGATGVDTRVRIMGMRYEDERDTCELTCVEV